MRVLKFLIGVPCLLIGLLILLKTFNDPVVVGNTPNELKVNFFAIACILIGYGWTIIRSKVKSIISFVAGAILLAIVLIVLLALFSNYNEFMQKKPSKLIGAIIVQAILGYGAFSLLNPEDPTQIKHKKETTLKPGESIDKGFCPKCGDVGVKTTGQGYNPGWVECLILLILCVVTFGGCLPFLGGWVIFNMLSNNGEKRCLQCGEILQL